MHKLSRAKYLSFLVKVNTTQSVTMTEWLQSFVRGKRRTLSPSLVVEARDSLEVSFFHRNLVRPKHTFVLGTPRAKTPSSRIYPNLDVESRVVDFQMGYYCFYDQLSQQGHTFESIRPIGMLVADFDSKPNRFPTFADFKASLETDKRFQDWIFIESRGGRVKGFCLVEQSTCDTKEINFHKRCAVLKWIFADYAPLLDLSLDSVSQSIFTATMKSEIASKSHGVHNIIGHLDALTTLATVAITVAPQDSICTKSRTKHPILPHPIEQLCTSSRSKKCRDIITHIMLAYRDGRKETPLNQKKIVQETQSNSEIVNRVIKRLEGLGYLKSVLNDAGHHYVAGVTSKTYYMASEWHSICALQGWFSNRDLPRQAPEDGEWYAYLKQAAQHFSNSELFLVHALRLPGIELKDRLQMAYRFAKFIDKCERN